MGNRLIAMRTALVLLLAAPVAFAADMCGGPCSFSIDFAAGGSAGSSGGATLTFGPGGVLTLGEGGSITLGEGGSITPQPAEGAAPDMSNGGSVVLGPNGSIVFGSGGALASGEGGGIALAPDSSFDIGSAGAVVIQSEGDLSIGDVDTGGGDIHYTAGNTLTQGEPPLVGINFLGTGSGADITATAGGDLYVGAISSSYGSAYLAANGGFGDGGGGGGSGGGSGSGVCLSTGAPADGCSDIILDPGSGAIEFPTLNQPTTSGNGFAVSSSDNAAGSLGFFGLLMGLAALGRRRR